MYCHEHVDGELNVDYGSHAKSHKRAQFVMGIHGNLEAAVNKCDEKGKEDNAADKAPFFSKDCEDKVRVMFRDEL